MSRNVCFVFAVLVAGPAVGNPPADDWRMETVRLRSGAVFTGLVLEENEREIKFISIRRLPGRPTFCLWTTFFRNEVDSSERLPQGEREKLAERIRALRADREDEAGRVRSLEVERAEKSSAWLYRSDRFLLESDADELIVRHSALRLEQIFAAYARYFPTRLIADKPTRVILVGDRRRYDEILRAEGWQFSNAALFDPTTRRVIACADLNRLGADLSRAADHHKQLREDLDKQERLLARLYKGNELLRHVQPVRDAKARILLAEKQNEALFESTTRKLYAALFHEAFHAYLDANVFPGESGEIPRWLNEGLAQLFESAILEAGELRVGHADAEKLERAKNLLRQDQLIPIDKLLRSAAPQFQTNSPGDRQTVETHYVTAWAWAQYLVFGRRMLNNPALADYVKELREGSDPWQAFSRLVRTDPALLERDFRNYLGRLQTDGTLANVQPTSR